MLSHVHLGVADVEGGMAFYAPLMAALGLRIAFHEPGATWAGWVSPEKARPVFMIGRPFDGGAPAPGNGNLVALLAPDRPRVDRCHALALANGGLDEGAPGARPHYHSDFYGAYFRDVDGNKLCVCCHDPAPNP